MVIAGNIMAFFGIKVLFEGSTGTQEILVSLLQIIGLTFSIFYIYQAYRRITGKQKIFWLLLGIGLFLTLAGNLTWIYYLITEGNKFLSDTAYFFWMSAYSFYLVALISRIKNATDISFRRVYVFNIIVFMVTTASILTHFLIEPMVKISDHSIYNMFITLIYPVVDLSILFVVITLYYLIHKNKEKSSMLLIIIGTVFQVTGDFHYAYLEITGAYYAAHPVSLLWLTAVWLIGFAAFYAKQDREEPKWIMKETFEKKEAVIPYVSTLILITLVIYNYSWDFNALSTGLLVIFIMIIGQQFYVMKENNKLIDEYRHLAYHDPLTGLNNRASFQEHLDNMITDTNNCTIGLLLIDLDRFKIINDTLGHQAGDDILVKTSEYLRQVLAPNIRIFRLGGDEFVIILPKATEKESAAVAENLLKRFQKPFFVKDHDIIVTASIGVSMYPKHGDTVQELFKYADAAMYLAKDGGRNGYRFYDDELSQIMARRMKIENDLRKGIEKKQFEVYYQPKVQLDTKIIIGMEALLRWKHPELGWISPAEFIPIAEETGSIVSIGEWVLRTACKQNKMWQKKGFPSLDLSVNVSVRQFQQGNFLTIIKKALDESRLNPSLLEIEITESIMQNTNKSVDILQQISKLGVRISIDDFGTGFSSLSVIRELPINTIKLDKAFIAKINDKKQQAMIKTIIDLGTALNLDVVAEGIENEYQRSMLLESNCTIGQGYLFARPVNSKRFEEILKDCIHPKSSKILLVPLSSKK